MKLLYLYVNLNRNLKESEINLDSNVRFSMKDRRLQVQIEDKIPPGFFAIGDDSDGVVESVSAMVGENGSGKTSIARHIAEIVSGKNLNRKFIAIFLINERFIAVYNEKYVDRSVFGQIQNLIPESQQYRQVEFAASFLYLSPHFTIERVLKSDNEKVFDYSTTGLMSDRKFRGRSSWGIANYSSREYLRALSVIAAYQQIGSAPSEPGDILGRSGVQIKIKRMLLSMPSYYSTAGQRKENTPQARFMQSIKQMSQRRRFNDFSVSEKILSAFILSKAKECLLGESYKDVRMLDRLADAYGRLAGNVHGSGRGGFDKSVLDGLSGALEQGMEGVVCALKELLIGVETLFRMPGAKISGETVFVDVAEDPSVVEALMRIVEGYSKCVGEEDFLQFSFVPALSSGEMAFLGMWGRLYQFFKEKETNARENYHAIVYLDESETALHPEWQRKLVWYTIWFMEHFAKHARVHIVYATHSPILLSDIPIGNVHFLKGVHDHKFRQREDLRRLHNTFAANVYDLYRLSFFMQEGTMGRFAYDKVNGLIKGTASLGSKAREDQISLIGDKMIRRYLQNKYAIEDSTRD